MEEVCSPGEGLRWWQIAADGQPGHHGWWRSNSETQLYPGAGSVEGKTFVRNARHYFGFVSLNILPGFFEIAQCTCCGFVDPFPKSSGIGYIDFFCSTTHSVTLSLQMRTSFTAGRGLDLEVLFCRLFSRSRIPYRILLLLSAAGRAPINIRWR